MVNKAVISISSSTIGVLALQGAFAKHAEILFSLGAKVQFVRTAAELMLCDALIIPGGESTTIHKQMLSGDLQEPFMLFAAKKPIFGTCAGIILMAREIIGEARQPYGLLDIAVERNAFGRQIESFHAILSADLGLEAAPVDALFIRAPRIRMVAKEVSVLASYEGEPVLVRQGQYLGATFHPELLGEQAIHSYFLQNLVLPNAHRS